MQNKPIIKLELSHYNSVPENIINHPPPKIEPKMKQEQQIPRIKALPQDLDDEGSPCDHQGKIKQQEQDSMQQLYRQLVESASWECPCGQKMHGPIQYFQHVKQRHQYDTLEQLVQQKTLRKVLELYPKICKEDIEIIEELDKTSISTALQQLANRHEQALKNRDVPALIGGGRGTFGDMASRFMQRLDKDSTQASVMLLFFAFLQEFVENEMGAEVWSQESPGEFLRYSNKILAYFCLNNLSRRYSPLGEDEIRRLIYLLAKWMFINHWTNDRIFNAAEPEETEAEAEKKQEGDANSS